MINDLAWRIQYAKDHPASDDDVRVWKENLEAPGEFRLTRMESLSLIARVEELKWEIDYNQREHNKLEAALLRTQANEMTKLRDQVERLAVEIAETYCGRCTENPCNYCQIAARVAVLAGKDADHD